MSLYELLIKYTTILVKYAKIYVPIFIKYAVKVFLVSVKVISGLLILSIFYFWFRALFDRSDDDPKTPILNHNLLVCSWTITFYAFIALAHILPILPFVVSLFHLHTGGFLTFWFCCFGVLFGFVKVEMIFLCVQMFTLFLFCPLLFVLAEPNDIPDYYEN